MTFPLQIFIYSFLLHFSFRLRRCNKDDRAGEVAAILTKTEIRNSEILPNCSIGEVAVIQLHIYT
jgi:hypothetical protein